jgi:hypothetical protein
MVTTAMVSTEATARETRTCRLAVARRGHGGAVEAASPGSPAPLAPEAAARVHVVPLYRAPVALLFANPCSGLPLVPPCLPLVGVRWSVRGLLPRETSLSDPCSAVSVTHFC